MKEEKIKQPVTWNSVLTNTLNSIRENPEYSKSEKYLMMGMVVVGGRTFQAMDAAINTTLAVSKKVAAVTRLKRLEEALERVDMNTQSFLELTVTSDESSREFAEKLSSEEPMKELEKRNELETNFERRSGLDIRIEGFEMPRILNSYGAESLEAVLVRIQIDSPDDSNPMTYATLEVLPPDEVGYDQEPYYVVCSVEDLEHQVGDRVYVKSGWGEIGATLSSVDSVIKESLVSEMETPGLREPKTREFASGEKTKEVEADAIEDRARVASSYEHLEHQVPKSIYVTPDSRGESEERFLGVVYTGQKFIGRVENIHVIKQDDKEPAVFAAVSISEDDYGESGKLYMDPGTPLLCRVDGLEHRVGDEIRVRPDSVNGEMAATFQSVPEIHPLGSIPDSDTPLFEERKKGLNGERVLSVDLNPGFVGTIEGIHELTTPDKNPVNLVTVEEGPHSFLCRVEDLKHQVGDRVRLNPEPGPDGLITRLETVEKVVESSSMKDYKPYVANARKPNMELDSLHRKVELPEAPTKVFTGTLVSVDAKRSNNYHYDDDNRWTVVARDDSFLKFRSSEMPDSEYALAANSIGKKVQISCSADGKAQVDLVQNRDRRKFVHEVPVSKPQTVEDYRKQVANAYKKPVLSQGNFVGKMANVERFYDKEKNESFTIVTVVGKDSVRVCRTPEVPNPHPERIGAAVKISEKLKAQLGKKVRVNSFLTKDGMRSSVKPVKDRSASKEMGR